MKFSKSAKVDEIEKILQDFPLVACCPQADKSTFKLEIYNENIPISFICDRESLMYQSEYLRNFLTRDFGKEGLNLGELDPIVFKGLKDFLLEKNQNFTNSSECNLTDLYGLSESFRIPHLSALCVKEIIQRLNKEEWKDTELLVPYRDEKGLLSTIFSKNEVS
jgi:hypothetical protein